ncbi:MAG TPA: pyridoxal-dependent decarboxylase [Rubrobacter sp.]|nr:pyridoxal-dependent decarboxylase [Rubrobacter sp.]
MKEREATPATEDTELRSLLGDAATLAAGYLEGLPDRRVTPSATVEELREEFCGPLPEEQQDPREVLAGLARSAEPGLMATSGGRFFGFVIGGTMPTALAADWLASAWDQNAGLYVAAPAASVVEEACGAWLSELFGLPDGVTFGLVTGGQMANFTALAAARHHVLERAGWDVEADGLLGAPRVRVLAGEERHVTIDRALRFLGLGTSSLRPVPADGQGRMRPDALRSALAESSEPTIICAQAGNVNTGAIDPLDDICDAAGDAWVHVDGAFGLWAAASPSLRHLIRGLEHADSWATDAHKWLNVPYDSGLVFCAHPRAHRAAMGTQASYLVASETGERDQLDWNPEASRRARGFPIYAAIRSLGRSGVADLVDRCCAHARRFAEALEREPGVEVLADVVLNQVLVRFLDPGGDHGSRTRTVIRAVQEDGTCWLGGTTWQGQVAMRISVSNWSTTTEDVDRSVEAILRAAR